MVVYLISMVQSQNSHLGVIGNDKGYVKLDVLLILYEKGRQLTRNICVECPFLTCSNSRRPRALHHQSAPRLKLLGLTGGRQLIPAPQSKAAASE